MQYQITSIDATNNSKKLQKNKSLISDGTKEDGWIIAMKDFHALNWLDFFLPILVFNVK